MIIISDCFYFFVVRPLTCPRPTCVDSQVLASYIARRGFALHQLNVLELGSGTGLVGLVAGYLGARVCITDQAYVTLFRPSAHNFRHSVVYLLPPADTVPSSRSWSAISPSTTYNQTSRRQNLTGASAKVGTIHVAPCTHSITISSSSLGENPCRSCNAPT